MKSRKDKLAEYNSNRKKLFNTLKQKFGFTDDEASVIINDIVSFVGTTIVFLEEDQQ